MSQRFFDEYGMFAFGKLYALLDTVSNDKENKNAARAAKIKEKIETYYRVNTLESGIENEDYKLIEIGWFGEELRDLLCIILVDCGLFYFPSGENKKFEQVKINTEIFKKLVEQKEKNLEDPDYYKKTQLKHFSPDAMFLSNEDEALLNKGKKILNAIGEKTNNLFLSVSDFPSRRWMLVRNQKTQTTAYDFQQAKDGWEVQKTFRKNNDNKIIATKFFLNINDLSVTKEESEETVENSSDSEIV